MTGTKNSTSGPNVSGLRLASHPLAEAVWPAASYASGSTTERSRVAQRADPALAAKRAERADATQDVFSFDAEDGLKTMVAKACGRRCDLVSGI
jgi:hypothetical protein